MARFGQDESLDNPTIRVTDIPGISQTNLVIHPRTKESLQKYNGHAVPGVIAHPSGIKIGGWGIKRGLTFAEYFFYSNKHCAQVSSILYDILVLGNSSSKSLF